MHLDFRDVKMGGNVHLIMEEIVTKVVKIMITTFYWLFQMYIYFICALTSKHLPSTHHVQALCSGQRYRVT